MEKQKLGTPVSQASHIQLTIEEVFGLLHFNPMVDCIWFCDLLGKEDIDRKLQCYSSSVLKFLGSIMGTPT